MRSIIDEIEEREERRLAIKTHKQNHWIAPTALIISILSLVVAVIAIILSLR